MTIFQEQKYDFMTFDYNMINANSIFPLGIIINLLPLYRLSYFVFCSLIIFVNFYVLVLTL
jgi:predicted neutral ceramidase superfamily lipid hydrolase